MTSEKTHDISKEISTSVGGGNTSSSPLHSSSSADKLEKIKARKWFITFWEMTSKTQEFIEKQKSWVWAKETCPTTKKVHFHAYIESKHQITFKTLQNTFDKKCDLQKAKGKPIQAFEYVAKDGDYKTNMPFKRKKPLKIITELYDWQKEVISIIEKEADDRTVHWYYSKQGSKGKTQMAKYLAVHHQALIIGGKASDIANGLKNYNEMNKTYPEVVLMNLARDVKNLSYKGMEMIKDGLVVNTKYECSQHIFNSPHLIVFANMEPDYKKLSKDRWHVVNLDK